MSDEPFRLTVRIEAQTIDGVVELMDAVRNYLNVTADHRHDVKFDGPWYPRRKDSWLSSSTEVSYPCSLDYQLWVPKRARGIGRDATIYRLPSGFTRS